MSPENRNLILAMAVSMAILVLWQSFFIEPQMQAEQQLQTLSKDLDSERTPLLNLENYEVKLQIEKLGLPHEYVHRIKMSAPLLEISNTSRRAKIDDLKLKN